MYCSTTTATKIKCRFGQIKTRTGKEREKKTQTSMETRNKANDFLD